MKTLEEMNLSQGEERRGGRDLAWSHEIFNVSGNVIGPQRMTAVVFASGLGLFFEGKHYAYIFWYNKK